MKSAIGLIAASWLITAAAQAAALEVMPYRERVWAGEPVEIMLKVKVPAEGLHVGWGLNYGQAAVLQGVAPVRGGEVVVKFNAPEVRTRIMATFAAGLYRVGEPLAVVDGPIHVFPRGTLDGLLELFRARTVGLVDPGGQLKGVCERIPLLWAALQSPAEVNRFDGPAILLAPNTTLSLPPGAAVSGLSPLEHALREKVRAGTTLVCFYQPKRPLKLPTLERSFPRGEFRKIRNLCPRHPALRSLTPADLGALTRAMPTPTNIIPWPSGGNYSVVLGVEGLAEPAAFMLELRLGTGRILMCQLPIVEQFTSEPLAELLWADILRCSLTEPPELKAAALSFPEETPLVKLLAHIGLPVKGPTDDKAIMLGDAAALVEAEADEFGAFLKRGGTAVLFLAGMEEVRHLNEHLHKRWGSDVRAEIPELALVTFPGQEEVAADSPEHLLLAGIRPEDVGTLGLWSAGGQWSTGRIRAVRDTEHFQSLIGDGLLAKYERDDARLIFWQVPLDAVKDEGAFRRVLNSLLTNIGVMLEPPTKAVADLNKEEGA